MTDYPQRIVHDVTLYSVSEVDDLFVVYSYVTSHYEDGTKGPTFKNWVAEFSDLSDAVNFSARMNGNG
jgi:hypothetical protein